MKKLHWQIISASGQISKPLTQEEIRKKILSGELSTDDKIRQFPAGRWSELALQKEFYDDLLNLIQKGPRQDLQTTNLTTNSQQQETVISRTEVFFQAPATQTVPEQKTAPSPVSQDVFELHKVSSIEKKIKAKSLKWPLLFFGVASILFVIGLTISFDSQKGLRPRLIYPENTSPQKFSADEQKSKYQKALSLYLSDQFENYLEAQNILVTLLESHPSHLEARGLICLVYREIWPFVRQDSKDLDTFQKMVKTTKSIDPVHGSNLYCEGSHLLVLGKVKDARGLIDFALNQHKFSTDPILYLMKAEILFFDKDLKSAYLYAEKSVQLLAFWAKSIYLKGFYAFETNQPQKALEAFQLNLKLHAKHRRSWMALGALYFEKYQQNDEALKYLISSTNIKTKLSPSDEAKAYFLIAMIYNTQNQLAEALRFCQKAFELNPTNGKIKNLLVQLGGSLDISKKGQYQNELLFLGDQYYRAGDYLSAQAEYKTAFELDPQNALAATKAGKSLWNLNQTQEAIQWLNKALQADPKLAMTYYLQADYLSQRYIYVQALQVLNRGSQQLPQHYEILRGYGLVEFRRNNFKEAVTYLQRALKIYNQDTETLILLAKSQAALKNFQEAQAFAVRAVELETTNNDAQIIYAKILTQFKGIDSGVYYIKDLINKFSYTYEFRLALADMYRDEERFKQALEIYQQIVELDPKQKKAHLGMGESYQKTGEYDKALRAFLSASILDPSDSEPLVKAGLVYMDAGKYSDAKTQFERALKINSLHPFANYYIGQAAFQMGDFNQALESAMHERKLNPNVAESYLLAADVYATTRDYNKCAAEYQLAIKLRPQGAELYVKMARCYRLSGQSEIAESMLNLAVQIESGLPEIYREQGAIYEQKNDRRSAIQAYNKYLLLSPNARDKVDIENRILEINQ